MDRTPVSDARPARVAYAVANRDVHDSIWYQESSLDTAKRTRELISCSMVLSAVRKDQYRSEADIHDHTPRDVAVGQLI